MPPNCRPDASPGIHALGWTRQQAVDYMRENTALSEGNINAEVNRYITWPGQALAYKLGEQFDLRAFHDAILENGSVPLDVLEAHVEGWIADQHAQ